MSTSFALVVLSSLASSTTSYSCVRVLPSGEELPLDSIFIDSIFAPSFFFEDGKCGGKLLTVHPSKPARKKHAEFLLERRRIPRRRLLCQDRLEQLVQMRFARLWGQFSSLFFLIPPPSVQTSRIFSTAASTTSPPTESTSRAPPSTPFAASLLLESTPGTSEKPDSSSPLPQLESATKDPQKEGIPSTRTLLGSLFRFRDHVSQNSTPKANPNPDFGFLGTTSCSVVFCCFYFRLHFENDGGGESRTLTEILSFRRISSHTTSKSPANPSPSTVSAKTGRALESELGPFTE